MYPYGYMYPSLGTPCLNTCRKLTKLVYFNSLAMQHNYSTLIYDTTIANQRTHSLS